MRRPKTIPELRSEIVAHPRLISESQETLSARIGVNQATVSRILRGRFKRYSKAVDRVCRYAQISRMTEAPLNEFEASLGRLNALAQDISPRQQHALKLIRLAAEILVTDLTPAPEGNGRHRRA